MIEIDEEFKNLIPPLKDYEFQQLEENCIKAGRIIEPLKVWNNDGKLILVDGHNRYRIAQEHNLPYTTEELKLESRNDVIVKMCDIQLGRRNLHELDGERLLSRKRKVLEEEAHKRSLSNLKKGTAEGEKLPPRDNGKTRDIIGKELGVSGRQVDKLHRINEMATPQVKDMVRNGTLSVNQAYNSTFPKVLDPVREAKERHEAFQEKAKNGMVDFYEAKLDKANQDLLHSALMQDSYKVFRTIKNFGFAHKTNEFKKLTKEERETLDYRFKECENVITVVRQSLKGGNEWK